MASRSDEIRWDRFPRVESTPEGKQWLEIQRMLGLAPNTVEAYGRGLEDFLGWCERSGAVATSASRADVAGYVGDLRARRRRSAGGGPMSGALPGASGWRDLAETAAALGVSV